MGIILRFKVKLPVKLRRIDNNRVADEIQRRGAYRRKSQPLADIGQCRQHPERQQDDFFMHQFSNFRIGQGAFCGNVKDPFHFAPGRQVKGLGGIIFIDELNRRLPASDKHENFLPERISGGIVDMGPDQNAWPQSDRLNFRMLLLEFPDQLLLGGFVVGIVLPYAAALEARTMRFTPLPAAACRILRVPPTLMDSARAASPSGRV